MFAPEKNRTPWYECQIRIVTGRARDAALGQVLVHDVGLLQPGQWARQDRVFDLHHGGTGPAGRGGWGGGSGTRTAGGQEQRQSACKRRSKPAQIPQRAVSV